MCASVCTSVCMWCVSVVCVLATLQFDAQTCRHLGRQTLRKLTESEREGGRERLTGENAVKTMQTRLSPGAEREQGARVVDAFVFRFYIQVDFIYSAKATTKK